MTIVGTEAADMLFGTDGDDVIDALGGDDIISGGLGADILFGGLGEDIFLLVRAAAGPVSKNGRIVGGDGIDTIDMSAVDAATLGAKYSGATPVGLVIVNGSQRFDVEEVERIQFGAGADILRPWAGYATPIELRAGGGADDIVVDGSATVYAEDGNDIAVLAGGYGTQAFSGLLDGGAGVDELMFTPGFDVDLATGAASVGLFAYTVRDFERIHAGVYGGRAIVLRGSDRDEIFDVPALWDDGSAGVLFDGRGGNDTLTGSRNNDTLSGGAGDDLILASAGTDTIDGGDGFDTLSFAGAGDSAWVTLYDGHAEGHALTGIERVIGTRFSDTMWSSAAGAVLEGGEGGDTLTGLSGNDTLLGGAGDDVFNDSGGDDAIDGGAGWDRLDLYGYPGSVTVDLAAGTMSGRGADLVSGVEEVWGTAGQDVLIGDDGANTLKGDRGADVIRGGGGNDVIESDPWGSDELGADIVEGGAGDDQIVIGINDSAIGGDDQDTLTVRMFGTNQGATVDLSQLWQGGTGTVGSATVSGFEIFDELRGTAGNDDIVLGTPVSTSFVGWILANEGDDAVTGGGIADRIFGGAGNDRIFGLGGDDYLGGDEGADRIEAGDGADTLVGGLGADTLVGGEGGDRYYYAIGELPSEDVIVEDQAAGGIDEIVMHTAAGGIDDSAFAGVRNIEQLRLSVGVGTSGSIDFRLGANASLAGFQRAYFSGSVDASAMTTGLELLQSQFTTFTMRAGQGDDRLGMDFVYPSGPWYQTWTFDGGAGTDTLVLASARMTEKMQPGGGTGDVVIANIERLLLLPGQDAYAREGASDAPATYERHALQLTDAHLAAGTRMVIDGSALRGDVAANLGRDDEIGGGDDIYVAELARIDASRLTAGRSIEAIGGASGDELTGSAWSDVLTGNDGNDRLDGGAGADTLAGGRGDDWFFVDTVADSVSEASGQGFDRVFTSVSYRLASGSEIELLVAGGPGPIELTGNEASQYLLGNAADNVLEGKGGADTSDGGAGNDWHIINDASDFVVERSGEGYDRAITGISYGLNPAAEVELLMPDTIAGTQALSLAGSNSVNTIFGNEGANLLSGLGGDDALWGFGGDDLMDGGAGSDSMFGGAGNDWYFVDSTRDQLIEEAGNGYDRVLASLSFQLGVGRSIELLMAADRNEILALELTGNELSNSIFGSAGFNVLSGLEGDDTLEGYEGSDILIGGLGRDRLSGGSGTDTFRFESDVDGSNVDQLLDFVSGEDRIELAQRVFTHLDAGWLPNSDAFALGSVALEADDHILFDQASGRLFYDADGTGAAAAVLFATLQPGTALAATDFFVI